MDLINQELGGNAQQANSADLLVREHRVLDEKVAEFSERSFLSPDDHLELARLKKEKLRVKDRIAAISSQEKSA